MTKSLLDCALRGKAIQCNFTGVEKYQEPQFTGKFADNHFEVNEQIM